VCLTVNTQIVVKILEERETVPRVRRLKFEHGVHINSKQRPEDLAVFNHQVAVPCKRLNTSSHSQAVLSLGQRAMPPSFSKLCEHDFATDAATKTI